MSPTAAIEGIRKAATQREWAEKMRRKATDELRERCRQAKAEGVPIAQIAREAGLSRQGVYDLLGDRQPS